MVDLPLSITYLAFAESKNMHRIKLCNPVLSACDVFCILVIRRIFVYNPISGLSFDMGLKEELVIYLPVHMWMSFSLASNTLFNLCCDSVSY